MTLKRRFFSAPTLTQALLAAARHHSADPDALDYQVIEKKQGFIKAPRGVVIEVDPDSPLRGEEEEATQPANPEESPDHPDLEPAAAAPAGKLTEVPFEPMVGEAPAEHPALSPVPSAWAPAAVEPPVESALPPEPAPAEELEVAAEPAAVEELPTVAESAPAEERAAEAVEVAATARDESPGEEPAADDVSSSQIEPPQPAPPETSAAAEEAEYSPSPEDRTADAPAPADDAAAPAPAAAEAAPPAVTDRALEEAVAEAVDELAFLAALRVQVARVESSEDELEVELDGPDSSRLAARGGRSLLAMQHLLPRLLFGRLGKAMRCHLDCDGFHAERSKRLEGLAQKAAERVRSGGRSWLLDPMAPDERRLVHMALAEVPDIETESVGQGFLKRVRVAQADQA